MFTISLQMFEICLDAELSEQNIHPKILLIDSNFIAMKLFRRFHWSILNVDMFCSLYVMDFRGIFMWEFIFMNWSFLSSFLCIFWKIYIIYCFSFLFQVSINNLCHFGGGSFFGVRFNTFFLCRVCWLGCLFRGCLT